MSAPEHRSSEDFWDEAEARYADECRREREEEDALYWEASIRRDPVLERDDFRHKTGPAQRITPSYGGVAGGASTTSREAA
jgi:hypothetical protein